MASGGSADGHAFEYWHLHAVVHNGERVEAYETVLGHVMAPAMHVHLTELKDEMAVNPLAPGHIGPYTDTTTPRVTSIAMRIPNGRGELLPNRLRGRVAVVAGARGRPDQRRARTVERSSGQPALLTWEIRTWQGRRVTKRHIGLDFRSRLPRSEEFWQVYARGTYQNMAMFNGHYSWGQRATYLFKLGSFDTRRLTNGAYDLVIVATDTRGNTGSAKQRFLVSR